MIELEKLYSERDFQKGKQYFHYANFPFLFTFSDKALENLTNNSLNEILLCYTTDNTYEMVFNKNKSGIYLKNSSANDNEYDILKKPIRLAQSLSELFDCINIVDNLMFMNTGEDEYDIYQQNTFYQYEEEYNYETKIPKCIVPNIDLRQFYKANYINGYFTDYKEHNPIKFKKFIERVKLENHIDAALFFNKRPDASRYMEFINVANSFEIDKKYFYVEFFHSGFQGIVFTDDLNDDSLSYFLKYGIIYNKLDVPERIYKLLE